MIQIRPFAHTDEEYAALIAISKRLEPETQLTVAMLRQSDKDYQAQTGLLERSMVEVDGRNVGNGLYFRAEDDENTLLFSMHIHPDFQASEVPARMQHHLLTRMHSHQPQKLAAEPREDQVYRIRLLEAARFDLKMRFPRSQQDVTTFDATQYTAVFAALAQQGIDLVTLSDVMQTDPDWQHHVWRMFNRINQDVPYPHPVDEVPFETYADYYTGDDFRPESWAIALDKNETGENQYVGMCVVNIMESRPDTLFAGITGTVPSHRRRKIATALKVKNTRYARRQGYRYIYTNNEENNPMYALNLQLGFQPLPAWLYYEKPMD